MVDDLRPVLRTAQRQPAAPWALRLESRTLPGTPETGPRAGYEGAKRRHGRQVPACGRGHARALGSGAGHVGHGTAQVAVLAEEVEAITGLSGTLAYGDQGYPGPEPGPAGAEQGLARQVVKVPAAKRGVVLRPKRWVVEVLLAGRPVSDDWPGMTNASPARWKACTTSSLRV